MIPYLLSRNISLPSFTLRLPEIDFLALNYTYQICIKGKTALHHAIPPNEVERLQALENLCIVGTPPEAHFDAAVDLVRTMLQVPIAFIAFQTEQDQWFKAHSGISVDAPRRDLAICNYTLLGREAFVVPDLAADPRFAWLPYVAGEPHLRFYAGIPLALSDGLPVGTFCVMDTRPRELTQQEQEVLQRFAVMVVSFLRQHEAERARQIAEAALERQELEAQLRQSQKLEVMGQLAGGIAHDFNNLLAVILGNAELMAEDLALVPRLKETADLIVETAERGSHLTHHLLAFSRKKAVSLERIDINEVVSSLTALLSRSLGAQVEIRTKLEPDLPLAFSDHAQLEAALINLSVNARDAMPEGGCLLLETKAVIVDGEELGGRLAAGPYIRVAVTDTGTGMPPEVVARVFEPFFTTKEAGKGTGLGLAMVYGFVKQSDGCIDISSEPGFGTTISLYLPAAKQEMILKEAYPANTVPLGSDEIVLLVEDEVSVQRLLKKFLGSLGYRVIACADGSSAVAELDKNTPFDVLLTDIIMPGGMNGRQIAEVVQERRPGTPMLFMSAYPATVLADNSPFGRNIQLLRKPFRKVQLAQAIHGALQHKGMQR